jgi:hypothetical protein
VDKIKIEGIPPYDGEYEFDVSYFTNREFHVIKRMASVRGAELLEALNAGDTDLFVALAAIALKRAGKIVHEDALWDAPPSAITFVDGDDEVPPAEAQKTSPNDVSSSGQTESSGPPSNDDLAPPANDPNPTGPPPSGPSAT